ncbi:hypothetical protein LSAT2_023502 [Lamellibrachia satsuma]|nr:hypothetical protein LSAT2_023502 [Lamellibrachia satsuma]
MTEHVLRKTPSLATALWATSVPIVTRKETKDVHANKARIQNPLKYSCDTRSPCFKANTGSGFYFEQSDPHKFIQCDASGGCHDKSCPKKQVWKQETPGCSKP